MPYIDNNKGKKYYRNQINKYKVYSGKVEKSLAEEFDKKLQDNNITYTYWLRKNIERYLQDCEIFFKNH